MNRQYRCFSLFLLLTMIVTALPSCGSRNSGKTPRRRDYSALVQDRMSEEWTALTMQALRQETEGLYLEASESVQTAILLLARKYQDKDYSARETPALLGARGEALLQKFAYFADRVYDYNDFTRFLEHIQTSLTPAFQARAQNFMSAGYWSTHDLPRAQTTWDQLNYITDWTLIGPFDNERGDGFNRTFDPETKIDLQASYEGKERDVRWRRLQVRPNFGRIDLLSMMRPNQESLAYGLSWIKVTQDTPAVLQWASDESAKLWVNDTEVYSKDIRRTGRFDQDQVPVKLVAGWNKLLVKSTTQQYGWSFSLRVTDLQGNPLPMQTSSAPERALNTVHTYTADDLADMQAYRASKSANEFYQDDVFLQQSYSALDFYLAGYFLNSAGSHDVKTHPDLECAEKALELMPHQSAFHILHAETLQISSAVDVEQEHNPYRTALQTSLQYSSRNAEAHLLLAEYYLSTMENQEKAKHHIAQAIDINPKFPRALLAQAQVFLYQHFRQEAYRQFDKTLSDFPDHIEAIEAFSYQLESLGRLNEASELLERALEIDSSLNHDRRRLVNLYNQRGLVEEALGGHLEILRYDPYAIESHRYRAAIFSSRNEFDRAASECEEALLVRPDDASLLQQAASYYYEMGNTDKAFAMWEQSLSIYPNNVSLREYLEFLQEDRQSLADLFPEDVNSILKNSLTLEQAKTQYPNEPVMFLLNKQISKINDDGTNRYLVHDIRRVLTDRGIEMMDWYYARRFGGGARIQFKVARIHKPDGSAQDARIGKGYAVDLPQLHVGDVVEVQYIVDVTAKSVFGDYFGETFLFGLPVPIEQAKYILIAPTDKSLYFHYRNMPELDPEIETMADRGWTVRTWTVTRPEKIATEPNMPKLDEIAPQVQVSTYASWEDFSVWYWNLIRRQHVVSPDMKSTIQDLVKDCTTQEEKIRAIYNWVVTKITYNDEWEFGVHGYQPYSADTIFQRKRGDCKDKAILINTMLGEVGIEAYPVLIAMAQSAARSEEDLSLPMVSHFNHCISYVPNAGKDNKGLFLDGTATYSSMDSFPDYDQGATVLVIEKDGGSVKTIPISGYEKDQSTETARLIIMPDGDALLSSTLQVTGSLTYAYRTLFQVDELRREQWENLYGNELSGSRMEGTPRYSDLSNLDEPVHVDYTMHLNGFSRDSGDNSLRCKANRFPLRNHFGWKAHMAQSWTDLYARNADRQHDIILPMPWSHRSVTEVILPDGYALQALPESVDLKNQYAELKIGYTRTPQGYRVEKWIASKSGRVHKENYELFRNFCIDLDKAEREEITIQKQQ